MKKSVIKLLGGVLFCACLVLSLCACGGDSSGSANQELDYTKGLVFEKVGEEYAVTGYTGIDTEVKIPANYKSLPVTSIAENAFEGSIFINNIDRVVNTSLIYEIGVLKVFAEPLLYSVKSDSPSYNEARRLINSLTGFFPIPSDYVKDDSVLREFIGKSSFENYK